MSADDIALLVLLVGEASGVFAGFCPSWFTVSSPFFHDQAAKQGNIKRIRWGEAAATAVVLATGLAITQVTGKMAPTVAAVGICALFIGGYEYMIANPSKDG